MITYRRRLLDRALYGAVPLMKGRVLDVGGKKTGKRGAFRPPLDKVASWSYLNPDAATGPDFCCGSESIPAVDGSFDTLVMTEVLEYLEDPATSLAEAARVLSPGGRLILTVPFLHALHGDWEADRQRLTEVKLRELSLAAGFEVERLETMGSLGAVVHDLLHASLAYAGSNGGRGPSRLMSSLLGFSFPFFRALDAFTGRQGKYINTGYFLSLRKPAGTRS
jgi:SAM-dependent methyltransferase